MGFILFGTFIPYYGFCILIGIVCAFILGHYLTRKSGYSTDDFLIVCSYMILFGLSGAKILYLVVSFKSIDFHLAFSSFENFNYLVSSGFVFYGGLIGGILGFVFIKKVHGIDSEKYARILTPCLALAHGFGRSGCSLAGCCYGKEWSGTFYFRYSESIIAKNGVKLFPVQGIEAGCLFILALVFSFVVICYPHKRVYLGYALCYSCIRFFLEFFRGDVERGFLVGLSTSQIISILLFFLVLLILCFSGFKKKTAVL